MNPIQLMEFHKPQFTPNDLLIYEKIMENPMHILRMTTSTLAEECGVSQSALSRFIKTLGFSRYQDFRAVLIEYLSRHSEQEAKLSEHLAYFGTIRRLLDEVEQVLTDEYMQELAGYIKGFKRIFTTGIGKSFHPAELMEILTYRTALHVHSTRLDPLGQLSDSLTEDDLLIVFSVSAHSRILEDIRGTAGNILLITANPAHRYADIIDREVLLPYVSAEPEASAISPVLFDMLVELLVPYLYS